MYKLFILLCLFIITYCRIYAQVLPNEGSKLYCRIIGFSFPSQKPAVKYEIEIAAGSYATESSFEKNKIISVYSNKNKIIAEVPSFGSQYTWRIVFIARDSTKLKSILYHFCTMITPSVDAAVTRLRITKSAEKYKDGYVFLDGVSVLYDMKGNPVWFLPGSDLANRDIYTRDMKLTPQGTITFMTGYQAYEISYSGKVLWQYKDNPANQNSNIFHHEFTRLDNGHYMGLRYEQEYRLLPAFRDSVAKNAADSARFYTYAQCNAIIEYDENNHIAWHWSDWEYIQNSDLIFRKPTDAELKDHDPHENSFYFDEKNKTIYLSFRNISRILKIKYPEGKVLNAYGPVYKQNGMDTADELFCGQHSCRLSQKGYLYLYDNNTCGTSHIPKIIMMQEPAPGKSTLKKIWEYQYPIEPGDSVVTENLMFNTGGNVLELPDRSMFVSMGKPYANVFIVNQAKKILWSAIPEKYDPAEKKWVPPNGLYRASIIPARKDLERLIWNSESLPSGSKE